MKENLISLGTFDANGCKYSSEGGDMNIVKGSLILMRGVMTGRLYVLRGIMITGSANVSTSTMMDYGSKLSLLRLGHISE